MWILYFPFLFSFFSIFYFFSSSHSFYIETAIYLAALILQISLGPYHEEMELWKPKQVLPPQFCDRYHRRILIPVYEKYSEFRTMATASAQRKFVNVTFQLPRTAYFRCMERGLIANHVALGLLIKIFFSLRLEKKKEKERKKTNERRKPTRTNSHSCWRLNFYALFCLFRLIFSSFHFLCFSIFISSLLSFSDDFSS